MIRITRPWFLAGDTVLLKGKAPDFLLPHHFGLVLSEEVTCTVYWLGRVMYTTPYDRLAVLSRLVSSRLASEDPANAAPPILPLCESEWVNPMAAAENEATLFAC